VKTIAIISALLLAISANAAEKLSVMVFTNGQICYPSNLWIANSNNINAVIRHPAPDKVSATLDGFDMLPVAQGNPSNIYWLDFGKSNAAGTPLVYATLTATNDVRFAGITNCDKWRMLSFNVVASGGNRLIQMPTNFPHISTNGLTYANGSYQLTLTNGNEFRMTIQSNSTLSTLWTTFGQ